MNPASFLAEHWWEILFAVIAAIVVAVFWEAIKKFFVSIFTWLGRLTAARRFERSYREWLINKYRFLNVRGIKTNVPVAIELEKVFVSLRAKMPSERPIPPELEPGAAASGIGYRDLTREPLRKITLAHLAAQQSEKREEDLVKEFEYEQAAAAGRIYSVTDLFGLPQKRFIIIGKPGSGKTTLLSFLALKFARRNAEELFGSDDEMLPVFVNLRDTIKQGFLDVKTFGEKYGRYIECAHCAPTDFFKQRLDEGKCLVLLDGLDEVSKPEERVEVAKWVDKLTAAYPKNVFIATSRPYGYETARLYNDFLELHILDFTPEQVEEFVRYWTKAVEIKARGDESDFTLKEAEKKAEDLLKAVKESPKIELLTVNPLLLTIVSLVHRYRATLPKRRVELYEECCDVLLGHWDIARGIAGELQPRQKRAILQPLAYHLQRSGLREEKREKIVEILENELPKIGVAKEKADDFLQDIRYRCGMLVETKLGFFGFAHLTFQEFLTARYILDADLENFLVTKKRDKYWLEITLLYCGMKDTTNLLQKIVKEKEDIFYTNLFLAGRCLAESLSVSAELRTVITRKLFDVCWDENEFGVLKQNSLETLEGTEDPQLIEKFIEDIKDKEIGVRRRAAFALGLMDAKEAVLPLIKLLKDKQSHVRRGAASALGRMQAKKAALPLIHLLKDKKGVVRRSAADALGQMRAKQAILPTMELLKDEQSDVRRRAASALGRMQAKEAVLPLIELSKDKQSDARGRAASSLGQIRAKEAVLPLIELLKDEQSDVRRRAASALGQIQAEEAVLPLIELLKDKESYVRWTAAFALGQMQAKEGVSPLIGLLKDKESYVRGRAIDALGQIQAKEAVLPLIELLQDKESEVRGSAVDALSHIQAKEAVLPLIELLKDKEGGVRGHAALALGQMQAKEAVLALIELLKDEEADVRGRAALALGQMHAKEAVSSLIELLKNKESYVRESAVDALGHIHSKGAVLPLIELLKDKESSVRASTTSALGRIQAKEAVLPLIELLKDKESDVRRHASEALGKIGEAKAVEPLKSLLTDTEVGVTFKGVRESAFAALREISDKTGTPIYRD